ncbi:ComF family protein [Arthrobacter cupressi]|uniref:Predicted amidophosphoribosyltransferases n=1 Tax=Arthrobacter cupressi TaxID=1045773 RepID=A0A1G8P393_9MICC|nr:phosphoribosyltransferase family protein [Arthrobacter cupressi]NYD76706.1 putative amidophosphoribosyltransferase [Arthrobacter cupressi]SDI86746.1 Predicted amidophosphoribosyltransferases [Arthrobacter cupressi]
MTHDAGRARVRDPDLSATDDFAARHRGRYAPPQLRLLEGLALAWGELLALLAPVQCLCCGREDTQLCGACARRIRRLCARPFRAESQAPALLTVGGTVLVPVVAVGPYREELAQAVLSFKKLGQRSVARLLGRMLEHGLRAAAGDARNVCLVPVPTSAAALRRRGFSPVHLLLRQVRRRNENGWVLRDALTKRRRGILAGARRSGPNMPSSRLLADGVGWLGARLAGRAGSAGQKGLDRGSRARRVRGSMVVRSAAGSAVSGKLCIIVDDVLTTGATLAEAARAVEAAGGIVCGAVVLAATRPPGGLDSGTETPTGSSMTQNKFKAPKG